MFTCCFHSFSDFISHNSQPGIIRCFSFSYNYVLLLFAYAYFNRIHLPPYDLYYIIPWHFRQKYQQKLEIPARPSQTFTNPHTFQTYVPIITDWFVPFSTFPFITSSRLFCPLTSHVGESRKHPFKNILPRPFVIHLRARLSAKQNAISSVFVGAHHQ